MRDSVVGLIGTSFPFTKLLQFVGDAGRPALLRSRSMSGHGIGCCRYLSLALLVWAGVDAPAVRTCLAQDPATSGPEPSRRTGGPLEKRVGSPYVELDSWIY